MTSMHYVSNTVMLKAITVGGWTLVSWRKLLSLSGINYPMVVDAPQVLSKTFWYHPSSLSACLQRVPRVQTRPRWDFHRISIVESERRSLSVPISLSGVSHSAFCHNYELQDGCMNSIHCNTKVNEIFEASWPTSAATNHLGLATHRCEY